MVAVGDLMKVSRDDIQDFPGETINLILQMQKEGWRAQRSNRNHVMLFAPDGETRLSASRNADSARYLSEDLRKYNKAQGRGEMVPAKVRTIAQKWPCPRPGCNRTFNAESKLNAHIGVDHEGLVKCPECDETFKDAKTLGRHRGLKHGYVSPRYAKRKAQEAKRQEKAILDEVIAVVDETPDIEEPIVSEKIDRNALSVDETGRIIGKIHDITVSNEGVYAYGKLNTGVSLVRNASDIVGGSIYAEPAGVEHVSFLDDRDSWTMKLDDIADKSVRDIQETLWAAGLKMEIRVWKES